MIAKRTDVAGTNDRPFNNLLRRLNAADYELIASHLAVVDAAAGDLLYNPGDDVQIVHFPCGPSLASYMVANEDGRDVETILVGREGAVGGIVSQGFLPAYTRITVKFGGPFVRLPISKLDAAKLTSISVRNIFARYADCMLAQIFQSTACNAIHSIEQRAAKWIMSAMERTNGNGVVPLTHEQLSTLLGVGTELNLGDGESDLVRAIRQSTQQSASQAGQQIVGKQLDVQPTLRIRPGWPLRVIVHKDLILRPWRAL